MTQTATLTLTEFLLARIAEDERTARAEWDWMIERHGSEFWTSGEGAPGDREWAYETDRDATLHVSPRRVLAECEAKRRIVELMRGSYSENDVEYWALHDALQLLALPYADHPDFRDEWRP